MNHETYRGERKLIRPETETGCGITRVTTGFAYPRNGNTHNPTASYRWDITHAGRLIDTATTLRDAKAIAAEVNAYIAQGR